MVLGESRGWDQAPGEEEEAAPWGDLADVNLPTAQL